MTTAEEVDQRVQLLQVLVPVPQGEEFHSRMEALCEEYELVLSEGSIYCPAEVSGAGMGFVSHS